MDGPDLFLGRVTRPHADVELAVFRPDQSLLRRHLAGWSFRKVVNGRFKPWPANEWLSLPALEIHARPPFGGTGIEFLLNEQSADEWMFRRDARVTLPLDRAIRPTVVGLPVLAPKIVLLFKAKSPRPKDEQDFAATSVSLGGNERAWLRAALAACHPGHPWAAAL